MSVSKKIIHWNRLHAALIFGVGVILCFYPNVWLLSLAAFCSFAYFGFLHLPLLKSYTPFAGYANWLTALRLLVVLSFGLLLEHCDHFTFFCIVLLVILADGLDGYLARKFNTASLFGAYFDMETDAFFVCMISLLLVQEALVPVWILGVGWMRYGAVLLEIGLGIHGQEAPPNPYARFIAGVLFVALLLPWLLPASIYMVPVGIAAGLVTFSFAYSFYLFFQK